MSTPRFVAVAATLAVVTACGESPTQLVDVGPLFAAMRGNPVVGSATGSAHAFCSFPLNTGGAGCSDDPLEGDLRTFSFNALLRADGSVSGPRPTSYASVS